ncbi:hypothetical protein ACN2XU_17065 [Primorskyibacter sp. 2E107]|uniref:hypothetical protein n=1 Tax=Primorskyibacter sp. 2E107 TaxID=3403458 RepID=UPI003AF9A341
MDRLSLYLTMMSATGIAGAFVIGFFTFGWYTWQAIAMSVVIGALTGWPAAKLVSRYIKDNDPLHNPPKGAKDHSLIPSPNAPEV